MGRHHCCDVDTHVHEKAKYRAGTFKARCGGRQRSTSLCSLYSSREEQPEQGRASRSRLRLDFGRLLRTTYSL